MALCTDQYRSFCKGFSFSYYFGFYNSLFQGRQLLYCMRNYLHNLLINVLIVYIIYVYSKDTLSIKGKTMSEHNKLQQLEQDNRYLKRLVQQHQLIHGIGKHINTEPNIDSILSQIVIAATGITGAENGYIFLTDMSTGYLSIRCQKRGNNSRLQIVNEKVKDQIALDVFEKQKPLRSISDNKTLKVATGFLVYSALYTPIIWNTASLGVLAVQNETRSRYFTEDDEKFLLQLAEYAAIAIRNQNQLISEQHQRKTLETLSAAMIESNKSSSIDELGGKIIYLISQILDFQEATVQVFNDYNSDRRLVSFKGFEAHKIDPYLLRPVSKDELVKRIIDTEHPLILSDPTLDADWENESQFTKGIRSWIGIPFITPKISGLITLGHYILGYYNEDIRPILNVISKEVSVVVENFLLRQSEQSQKQLAEALSSIAVTVNTPLNLDTVLERVLSTVGEVVPYEHANIMLIDKEGIAIIKKEAGYNSESVLGLQIKINEFSTFSSMYKSKSAILIQDVKTSQAWKGIENTPEIGSYIGSPIISDNDVVGFLNLSSKESNFFNPEQTISLEAFSRQIAVAIRKTRLLEEVQSKANHLQIINESTFLLNNKLEAYDLLKSIVEKVHEELNCTHCTLFLYDKDENRIVPKVSSGLKRVNLDRPFKVGEGIVGWAYEHGESLLLDDATNDSRFAPSRTNTSALTRSMIATPIKAGSRTIGVICADQDITGWFDESGKQLLETLSQYAGIAIERSNGLEILHTTTDDLISSVITNNVLENIVKGAIKLTNTSTGIIYLISIEDEPRITGHFKHPPDFAHPEPRFHISNGLTHTLIKSGKEIVISNLHNAKKDYPELNINKELLEHYSAMIGIPLKYGSDIVGVLYVHDKSIHDFTEIEVSLLSTLARLAAISIRNSQLFEETQRHSIELDTLNRIGQYISLNSLPNTTDNLLQVIYDQVAKLMDVTNFYIAFWDSKRKHISFEFVREYGDSIKFDDHDWFDREGENGLTEYVATIQEALLLKSEISNWLQEHAVNCFGTMPKTWLGVPMIVGTRTIGVITIQSYEKEFAYTDQQKDLLLAIASQAAIAIEKSRLYNQVQSNYRMLDLLRQSNQMLTSNPNKKLDELFKTSIYKTCEVIGASEITIMVIDHSGEKEKIVSSTENPLLNVENIFEYSREIWQTQKPIHISDINVAVDRNEITYLSNNISSGSLLCLPWVANKISLGVVYIYYTQPRSISILEIDNLKSHFDQVAFVYQSALLIQEQYQQRETMLSILAHEINIPLVALAGTANALKEEIGSSSPEMEEMSSRIIEQSQKIELLTGTILFTFGRAVKPVSFTRHSIYRPLIEACQLFERSAKEKQCDIQKPKAQNGHFPSVDMSLHHLILAFQNLISNAVKYSYFPKTGSTDQRYITIIGDFEEDNPDRYTISIQNYGVGIDEDEIKSGRLFHPFVRGKFSGDRDRPGKGLGLTLVKHIIEVVHNGDINITSEKVAGGAFITTITVSIPIKKDS